MKLPRAIRPIDGSTLPMPFRYALGAIILGSYGATFIYAVFPSSEVGRAILSIFEYALGGALAILTLLGIVQVLHSLILSVVAFAKGKPRVWVYIRASDGTPPYRTIKSVGFVCVFLMVLGAWMAIIGFTAYVVTFGHFGFIPSFRDVG